jgi:hypothetical protein
MSTSEVQRLREQILLECEALNRALNDFAMSGRHEFITHRYESLGSYQDRLGALIGEDEATRVVLETYQDSVEENDPHLD